MRPADAADAQGAEDATPAPGGLGTGPMRFDFFGVTVEFSGVPRDERDARFFYGAHEAAEAAPEARVGLWCPDWPERGFFTSLLRKDGLEKRITVSTRGPDGWEQQVDHRFTTWSELPSPLPPFQHSRLWTTVASHPGCCLRDPDGRGVLLLGSHYVGKTAIALALCRRGWRLVSDSVVVMRIADGMMLRYASPIGVRRRTLVGLVPVLERLDRRETVNPETGLVVLTRPEDLVGAPNAPEARVRSIVLIAREPGEERVERIRTPTMRWYSGADQSRVRAHLPSVASAVTVPPDSPPSRAADLVTEQCR